MRPVKCLRGRLSIRQLSVTPCRYEDVTGNVTTITPFSDPVPTATFSDPVPTATFSDPVTIPTASEAVTPPLIPEGAAVSETAPELSVELSQVFTENAPG